jgi:hypothetical protein
VSCYYLTSVALRSYHSPVHQGAQLYNSISYIYGPILQKTVTTEFLNDLGADFTSTFLINLIECHVASSAEQSHQVVLQT